MYNQLSLRTIKRVFASFGGKCQYRCNHCYTFIDEFSTLKIKSISDIIHELETKEFNIIYISGYNENFYIPNDGIELIEELYDCFRCNILFTTRNVFDNECLRKISKINERMLKDGCKLFACVSISAYESYKKLEPNIIIPSPKQRINFVKDMYQNNIITFLTLRPVCPNSFIPTNEYIQILNEVEKDCTGVISSGIVVNDEILRRLNDFSDEFLAEERPLMPCLNQKNIFVKYINVEKELNIIRDRCKQLSLPFYSSSIDAIQKTVFGLI